MSELNERSQDLLERIDILAAYNSWGIQTTKSQPSSKGWLECHAHGRQDKNPSAGINLSDDLTLRGRYNEFNGECRNLSFWDAGALFGPHENWQATRKHYADQEGFKLTAEPKTKKKPKQKPPAATEGQKPYLKLIPWIEAVAERWLTKMPGVDLRVLLPTGSSLGTCKGKSVICWPVHVGDKVVGHYYRNSLPGKPLKLRDATHKQLLTPGCSPCGWINTGGLKALKAATRVLWVEGVPDLLAAETARIREGIDDLVVLTSSHGCMTLPSDECLALLEGIPTWIIGDADKDGQLGVDKKAAQLQYFTDAGTWQLPYEIEIKHGKDLRDWLLEGNTLSSLLSSLEKPVGRKAETPPANQRTEQSPVSPATTVIATKEPEGSSSQASDLLEKLNLHVAGRTEEGHLVIWNGDYARWETVKSIERWGFDGFLSIAGKRGNALVSPKFIEDDDRLPWSVLRREIAIQSADTTVKVDNRYGPGIWQVRDTNNHRVEGEVAIVTREWAAIWDGESLTRLTAPSYKGMVLEIGTGEQWIQYDGFSDLLTRAADRLWAKETLDDAVAMFSSWRWCSQDEDPELVVGLILGTFIQDLLSWCPQVVVIGESNTGKSMLLEALGALFTPLALKASAHSTDVGVRQAIGNSCRPTLLDEWDTTKNRESLLLMIRTASRGDARLVGTSQQKAVRSRLKQMFWLAGITSGMSDQADQNRFVHLQLLPPRVKDKGRLQLRSESGLLELGHRLLALSIVHGSQATQRAREIREASRDIKADARMVESYAVPTSMWSTSLGLDQVESQEALTSLLTSAEHKDIQTDQDALMESILSQAVDAGGVMRKKSIGQLLRLFEVDCSADAEDALQREGIAIGWIDEDVDPENGGEFREQRKVILFAFSLIQNSLLSGTKWEGRTIVELLCRIKTAKNIGRKRFGGVQLTWVAIDYEHFSATYGSGGQRNFV